MHLALRITRSATLCARLGICLLAMPSMASRFHRGPTSSHAHGTKTTKSHGRVSRHPDSGMAAGRPRAIDDSRATQIQTALVKAGYLQTASGKWDTESADAMRKLQGDNGWQTKIIPDSRALIKLGLGPGSETPRTTTPVGTTAGPTFPMAAAPLERAGEQLQ